MWDDITIGKKEHHERLCSATHCFQIKGEHSISENIQEYWITGLILNFGMRLYKDCNEGRKLTKMIESGKGLLYINKYLDNLVLKNISLDKVRIQIKNYGEKMLRRGQELKQDEIRNALGI